MAVDEIIVAKNAKGELSIIQERETQPIGSRTGLPVGTSLIDKELLARILTYTKFATTDELVAALGLTDERPGKVSPVERIR